MSLIGRTVWKVHMIGILCSKHYEECMYMLCAFFQNSRYMYYGAGLLSTLDRYPERKISRPVLPPPTSTRGRRGRRPSERGASTRGVTKARRGRGTKDVRAPTTETSDVVR